MILFHNPMHKDIFMKRTFILSITMFLILQTVVSVWAGEKVNLRSNIKHAQELLPRIENWIKEENYEEADKLWQQAYKAINETYNDTTMLKKKAYEELMKSREDIENALRMYREKIDIVVIQTKIWRGESKAAIKYLEDTLNSDFYQGVGSFYIGNSYYHTGQFFQEEKDYKNAEFCYIQAIEYLEKTSHGWRDTEEIKRSRMILSELHDYLFDIYFFQGDFEKSNEILSEILKKERSYNSEETKRYRKYKEIKDTFPLYVLSRYFENQSPKKAFEQFVLILDGDYGKNLSLAQKNHIYELAEIFFEEKSQPELVSECKNKQMEIYEKSIKEKSYRSSEKEDIYKSYEDILNQRLEEGEKNKDYKTVFEFRKKKLNTIKEKVGDHHPLYTLECRKNMDYFLDLGKIDSAKYFFDVYFSIKEQIKNDVNSNRANYLPFTFFVWDLSDYAQNYQKRNHVLYEPERQKEENQRCAMFAPEGDAVKEFNFYENYYQFLQAQKTPGDDLKKMADTLFEMIKDPVFQQIEYFQPILILGTYYQNSQNFEEAMFCANLAGIIMSFYMDSDYTDNFFPILLRAAVLKDSGNSEKANAEVEKLITDGILQRAARLSSVDDFDSIIEQWPFGKPQKSMSTNCLTLINESKVIPESILEDKIICYKSGTYPILFIIKLANQYEKSGQFTQSLLLYQFMEKFFSDSSVSQNALKEIIDSLEAKRKKR